MTSQAHITCTIRRKQIVKGMTSRANLYKELIIWTLNQIVNGHNTVYVTKSPKALEKRIDSVLLVQQLRSLPKLGERIECLVLVTVQWRSSTGKVIAGLAERNSGISSGMTLKSHLHWDQLLAKRSVTSIREFYLLPYVVNKYTFIILWPTFTLLSPTLCLEWVNGS